MQLVLKPGDANCGVCSKTLCLYRRSFPARYAAYRALDVHDCDLFKPLTHRRYEKKLLREAEPVDQGALF